MVLALGCATQPKPGVEAFQFTKTNWDQAFFDDQNLQGFRPALSTHLKYWKSVSAPARISFGDRIVIEKGSYIKSLEAFEKFLAGEPSADEVAQYLQSKFELVLVQAQGKSPGSTLVTSYFEPVLQARTQRDDRYSQPLYALPQDLVSVDMSAFARVHPRWSFFESQNTEQKSRDAILRGRLLRGDLQEVPKVIPYHSRREIDELGQMGDAAKVLAYVDPLDSFFLQIQGSGVLEFAGGRQMRVGYAAQNGHPYTAIGKFLFPAISREQMSLQSIDAYLRQLSAEEQRAFLNANASYVFFRKLEGRGETYMGTPVFDGRTIATDHTIFPKGTMAWVQIEGLPNQKISRLVFDQDTGGAIRGPHRVDFFWGQGDEAKEQAGSIQHPGRIVYLIPK